MQAVVIGGRRGVRCGYICANLLHFYRNNLMKRSILAVALSLGTLFVVGAIIIIMNGRPVTQMARAAQVTATDNVTPANIQNVYTMTDVETHAVADNCWSAVNGNVYDLSTWVSRHPGGPKGIMSLCGNDGSDSFNGKHSGFTAAEEALVLLKIGSLAQ